MNPKYDKLITKHRLKLQFFFFLKKIKQSFMHKLFLINIYFFIRNHSFHHFISIGKLKIKRNHLRNRIKQMRIKQFFNKTKEIVNSIKNPNGKISSVHAYLFYFQALKLKIIQGFRESIKQSKNHNRAIVALYSIRAKIAMTVLFSQLKKCYYLKNLPDKAKEFNRRIILKTLKAYSKYEITTNEKYRLIRRFVYINTVKYAVTHISKKGLKMVIEENKIINALKRILMNKGVRMLKENINIITKLRRKKEIKYCLASKHFIKRIKLHITNKHLLQKNILLTIKKIALIQNKKNLLEIYSLYQNSIKKEEHLKSVLMRKISLKLMRQFIMNNTKLNAKASNLQSLIRINRLKNFTQLKAGVKSKSIINQMKHMSNMQITNKEKAKILNALKSNRASKKKKMTTISTCNNHYNIKLQQQLIKRLILNKTIQQKKKKEYDELFHMRNKIIAKKIVQQLIVTYSQNITQKENYISNQLITKRSRGLKAAFLWFNKLKALVVLKKRHRISNVLLEKPIEKNSIISKSIPSVVQKKNIVKESASSTQEKLIDDLNQLKILRNKKRIAPKKLELN